MVECVLCADFGNIAGVLGLRRGVKFRTGLRLTSSELTCCVCLTCGPGMTGIDGV